MSGGGLFSESLIAHVVAELVPGGPEGDEDAGEAGHREEEDANGVGRHGDDDTPRVVPVGVGDWLWMLLPGRGAVAGRAQVTFF